MGRGTIRCAVVAALACLGVVGAGCSGERDTGKGREVEAVVKRFAAADGPEACELLDGHALVRVYGRSTRDLSASRASCLKASKRFAGAPVEVTFVKFSQPTTAHATVRTPDGHRYFAVTLAKRRGRWLIDTVAPVPKPG